MDSLSLIGKPAPDFTLDDPDGHPHSLSNTRGKIVVMNIWSAECPWSEQGDEELLTYTQEWGDRVLIWTIAANSNEDVALIREESARRGLDLVLIDSDQTVADLYNAQITPHVYLVDNQRILRYSGAINNRTFRQKVADQFFLRDAVDAVLKGEDPNPAQTQAYGCAILRFPHDRNA